MQPQNNIFRGLLKVFYILSYNNDHVTILIYCFYWVEIVIILTIS